MDCPIRKLYYSISEVSQLTALEKYVLRYWETEFEELSPSKNRSGNRIYRIDDIKLIFLIKRLLYEDKYTIEGARKRLRELKANTTGTQEDIEAIDRSVVKTVINEFEHELQDLLAVLDCHQHDRGVAQSG